MHCCVWLSVPLRQKPWIRDTENCTHTTNLQPQVHIEILLIMLEIFDVNMFGKLLSYKRVNQKVLTTLSGPVVKHLPCLRDVMGSVASPAIPKSFKMVLKMLDQGEKCVTNLKIH